MIGTFEISLEALFSDPQVLEIFFISRLPRLLAVLCSGAGLSIAGLIMQRLCANKFVSLTTGATIASAQLGILFALLFLSQAGIVGSVAFAFAAAVIGVLTNF